MEYIKRCKICGKIWCYTDEDVKNNARNALAGSLSAIGSVANSIGGTRYDAYEQNKMANMALNRIVEYNKCPYCNSRDIMSITKEDIKRIEDVEEKKKNNYFNNISKEELIGKIEKFIKNKDWISASLYIEQSTEIPIDMLPKEDTKLYLLKLYIENEASNDAELIIKCVQKRKRLDSSKTFEYLKKYGDKETNEKIEKLCKEISIKIEKELEKEKQLQDERKEKNVKRYKKIIALILLLIIVGVIIYAIIANIQKYSKISSVREKIKEANSFSEIVSICSQDFEYKSDIELDIQEKLIEYILNNKDNINATYSYDDEKSDTTSKRNPNDYEPSEKIISVHIKDENNVYVFPRSIVGKNEISAIEEINDSQKYKYKITDAYSSEYAKYSGGTLDDHISLQLTPINGEEKIFISYFGDEDYINIYTYDNNNNWVSHNLLSKYNKISK